LFELRRRHRPALNRVGAPVSQPAIEVFEALDPDAEYEPLGANPELSVTVFPELVEILTTNSRSRRAFARSARRGAF
jgi:hypothetical protein